MPQDLTWQRVGPDHIPAPELVDRHFRVANYSVNQDMGNYTQWVDIKITIDMSVKPPQLWRSVSRGHGTMQEVQWATAKLPV
jgi:hypothetical protein